MHKFLIVTAAVVFASATPAAAQDAWRIGADAFNVHLRDLDLRGPADRAQALARVEAAATKLCRRAGTLEARTTCRDKILAEAAQAPGAAFVPLALAERERTNVRLARAK